jgi:hypothetical protein
MKNLFHKTLKLEFGLFNVKTRFILVTVQEELNGHYSVTLKVADRYIKIFCEDQAEVNNLFKALGTAGEMFVTEMENSATSS